MSLLSIKSIAPAVALAIVSTVFPAHAQQRATLERNVRAHLGFLASDALQGRKSASPYERVAAEYIASQYALIGLEPAGDKLPDGSVSFVQRVPLEQERFTAPPTLKAGAVELRYGQDFRVPFISGSSISGPLLKVKAGAPIEKGSFVFFEPDAASQAGNAGAFRAYGAGAAGAIVVQDPPGPSGWSDPLPELGARLKGADADRPFVMIVVRSDKAAELASLEPGAPISFGGPSEKLADAATWNAVGVLRGRVDEAIVLGAHLDHLGIGSPKDGDAIYNGADDDASGVTAVIELARSLRVGPRLRRTVYFACFGSEESGGAGAKYFVDHSPVPLSSIIAEIEFEMIGRADPAVAAQTLWLTGYERSNLGPELARRRARLVGDPHPEQNFFQRSDNYTLAVRGVVAHTVSSYNLHKDYHSPSDEVSKIDVPHMARSIASMVVPIRWLASVAFRPQWRAGMAPKARE